MPYRVTDDMVPFIVCIEETFQDEVARRSTRNQWLPKEGWRPKFGVEQYNKLQPLGLGYDVAGRCGQSWGREELRKPLPFKATLAYRSLHMNRASAMTCWQDVDDDTYYSIHMNILDDMLKSKNVDIVGGEIEAVWRFVKLTGGYIYVAPSCILEAK